MLLQSIVSLPISRNKISYISYLLARQTRQTRQKYKLGKHDSDTFLTNLTQYFSLKNSFIVFLVVASCSVHINSLES